MAKVGGGNEDEGWIDHLERRGTITQEERGAARRAGGDPLKWLVDQGVLPEKLLSEREAYRKGCPFVDLDRVPVHPADAFPFAQAFELQAIPLKKTDGAVWVAMADPNDETIAQIASLTGLEVAPLVAASSQIEAKLAHFRAHPALWAAEPPRSPVDWLLFRNSIDADQAAAAHRSGDDPVRWLLNVGAIGEHEFALSRAREYGLEYLGPDDGSLRNQATGSVPPDLARQLDVLPLMWRDETLLVAIGDPRDAELIPRAEKATGLKIEPMFVLQLRDLEEALSRED